MNFFYLFLDTLYNPHLKGAFFFFSQLPNPSEVYYSHSHLSPIVRRVSSIHNNISSLLLDLCRHLSISYYDDELKPQDINSFSLIFQNRTYDKSSLIFLGRHLSNRHISSTIHYLFPRSYFPLPVIVYLTFTLSYPQDLILSLLSLLSFDQSPVVKPTTGFCSPPFVQSTRRELGIPVWFRVHDVFGVL